MEIREATYADSWDIEVLLSQYEDEVVKTNPSVFFPGIFSRQKLTQSVVQHIDDNDSVVIIAVHNGNIVGFMRAMRQPYFFTEAISIELNMIFVSQGIRSSLLGGRVAISLMKEFMSWAEAKKADVLGIASISGLKYESMNKMIDKLGFETIGFTSMKKIGNRYG